ncbi:hypothetical protein [uncultured Chryseobacterium sp.]|uniref:hypothetical protein n=1 Tax=uncultured Chryseobacterium sp. TaxID=259322 RepID=UPI0025EF0313|nr:hypothetical protein [uncultured Chryseobacterium sp.]
MKKKKIDFESGGWSGSCHLSALGLMETFFQFYDPATAKNVLAEMMAHSRKAKVLRKKNPSEIFHFYLALRSLVRAGYRMQFKTQKRKFQVPVAQVPASDLMLGSLSEEEYRNPILVLQKTFRKFTIRDFDSFLSDITCFSLGTFQKGPEGDTVTPFLRLNKILDAAQFIVERAAMVSDDEK